MKAKPVKFDKRTEKNLATLNRKVEPEFRTLVLIAKEIAEEMDLTVKVISGNRTWAEQDELYSRGRTTRGPKVTNARAGYSNHNYGIAIDFGLFRGNDYLDGSDPEFSNKFYQMVSDSAKANGLRIKWGGEWKSFNDPPHFQYDTGYKMAEMRKRFANGQPIV